MTMIMHAGIGKLKTFACVGAVLATIGWVFWPATPSHFRSDRIYLAEFSGGGDLLVTAFSIRSFCEEIRMDSPSHGRDGACMSGSQLVRPGDSRFYAVTIRGDEIEEVFGAFQDKANCERLAAAVNVEGCRRLDR